MRFQERIGDAIKQSEYTQKQIAQRLNISEGNISNWKKGENLPSLDIFYKLCVLLDESADYLLGLDEGSAQDCRVRYENSTHIGDNNFQK